MAIDTLLFDLDGTLVDQVMPGSELQFVYLVLRRFWGLAPLGATYHAGRAAHHALKHHRTASTNHEAMLGAFCRHSGVAPERALEALARLAEEDFTAMAWRFRPIPGAREAVLLGHDRGFRLVLATNPTTPLPMTLHRLRWAGLDQVPWALVTHPENMTRSKPDVGYYTELLARLEARPEQCLMIGNDFRKDLPAMEAGIRTFLLDRPMSRKAARARSAYTPDHFGGYDDLRALIASLAAEA